MRRSIGVAVLSLGVFFLALAPLLRFYAAPKLIAAPVDEYAKITMTGTNGQYFSPDTGQMVQAPLFGGGKLGELRRSRFLHASGPRSPSANDCERLFALFYR